MRIFRITFINQGKVYQLFAESVKQAEVFGFLEIRNLVFGEASTLVIDPAEEKLKAEFNGVSRTLVPLQAVIRVDEVEKRGQCKIMDLDGNANITPFPNPYFRPDKGSNS